jgi:putative Ca2+/H+ antiporter (TMEM165/GDT1 family)
MILLAELGDKTQITAGLFATQYNMYLVFLGVMSALALLTAMAVIIGRTVTKYLHQKYVVWISGVLFIAIGIATLFPVIQAFF